MIAWGVPRLKNAAISVGKYNRIASSPRPRGINNRETIRPETAPSPTRRALAPEVETYDQSRCLRCWDVFPLPDSMQRTVGTQSLTGTDLNSASSCAIRGLEAPLMTGEDGKMVLEAIYASYASAGLGQKVLFPYQPTEQLPVYEWLNRKKA